MKNNDKKKLLCIYLLLYLVVYPFCFADDLTDSEKIFNWAEKDYSHYFSPANAQSSSIFGYWARYYKTTDSYIGSKDGQLFVYGKVFDGLLPIGSISQWLPLATEIKPLANEKGHLNDTGLTWGIDFPNSKNSSCTGSTINAQDCSHGRDLTHNDNSDGHAGFSFTKLDASGNELLSSASQWSCVRDNVTELVWEIKTDDDSIHDKDNTYRWGGVSALGSGTIGDYYNDWDNLVNGSNAERLCGFSDWRVPTIDELSSISNYGHFQNAIDMDYFPNANRAWSSSPYAPYLSYAWNINFVDGNIYHSGRNNNYSVRLVYSK